MKRLHPTPGYFFNRLVGQVRTATPRPRRRRVASAIRGLSLGGLHGRRGERSEGGGFSAEAGRIPVPGKQEPPLLSPVNFLRYPPERVAGCCRDNAPPLMRPCHVAPGPAARYERWAMMRARWAGERAVSARRRWRRGRGSWGRVGCGVFMLLLSRRERAIASRYLP